MAIREELFLVEDLIAVGLSAKVATTCMPDEMAMFTDAIKMGVGANGTMAVGIRFRSPVAVMSRRGIA